MLVWGSHGKLVDLGRAQSYHCNACGQQQPFNLMSSYRVHHIWWLIRWITGREDLVECPSCRAVYKASAADAATAQSTKAIPFFDRYGWTFGAGLVVAFFILVAVMPAPPPVDNSYQRELIAAPRVNDLYEINLARLVARPEAPTMYSVVRVRAVDPGGVTVQLPGTYFTDSRGTLRDIQRQAYQAADYFTPETRQIGLADLQRMQQAGQLVGVTRP